MENILGFKPESLQYNGVTFETWTFILTRIHPAESLLQILESTYVVVMRLILTRRAGDEWTTFVGVGEEEEKIFLQEMKKKPFILWQDFVWNKFYN